MTVDNILHVHYFAGAYQGYKADDVLHIVGYPGDKFDNKEYKSFRLRRKYDYYGD